MHDVWGISSIRLFSYMWCIFCASFISSSFILPIGVWTYALLVLTFSWIWFDCFNHVRNGWEKPWISLVKEVTFLLLDAVGLTEDIFLSIISMSLLVKISFLNGDSAEYFRLTKICKMDKTDNIRQNLTKSNKIRQKKHKLCWRYSFYICMRFAWTNGTKLSKQVKIGCNVLT